VSRSRLSRRDRGAIAARSMEILRALWWIETQSLIEFNMALDILSTFKLVKIFAAAIFREAAAKKSLKTISQ
jgi:hypothetical protein